jgi:predicted adenylyl cyclase CyaB
MNIKNFEFKAKVDNLEKYESKLLTLLPLFKGEDHQIDTYFNVPAGRLKLREGNIENALINYNREDLSSAKLSDIILYRHTPDKALKNILSLQLGVKIVVDKKRKIYFIDNVKFHFDIVEGLGTFLEVEAIDTDNSFTIEELKAQCDKYYQFFELQESNIISKSYSDLILEQQKK